MLQTARRNQTIALLKEKQHVSVKELADRFNVSEETIRRDLKNLEQQGVITKEHGGANISKPLDTEATFRERSVRNLEQKQSIAAKAVELIAPGDVIMLDSSTSAYELAKLIPDMPVTVITNSIMVIQRLALHPSIRIISTGGLLDRERMTFFGEIAEEMLGNFNAGKFFFSCQGIDLEAGLSETSMDIIRGKRKMLAASREHILLADSDKFTIRAVYRSFPLAEIHTIVTDDGLPGDLAGKITGAGIRLIYGT